MSTATRARITSVALGLLTTTAACGASGGRSVDAGPIPTRTPTTSVDDTSTTVFHNPLATEVVLYFVGDEKIRPVKRLVPTVTRIGAEAVTTLLGGPNADDAALGLGTAIPPETHFNSLVITDGVAKVDLSKAFESGGGSLSLSLRLAQVTCTLDQFESVTGVRFLLDGELVNVFSGNGIVLDKPVSCADYREYVQDGTPVATELLPGIWPFTSQAEMDAYLSGSDRTFTNPTETARQFASQYVGMQSPVTFGPPTVAAGGLLEVKVGVGVGEGGVPIADPQPTMSVFLQGGHADGDQGLWTVVSATSPVIVVDTPADRDSVSSPVRVSGRDNTFEGTVEVEVREDGMLAGQALGKGFVTGGMGQLTPFEGAITFSPPTKPAGAVVFFERSMADGQGVLRATVVRVGFSRS